ILVDGLTGEAGADVQNGVWNLFVPRGGGPEREMRYALPFHGNDGALYALRGTKVFRPHPGLRLWAENTTLALGARRGGAARAPAVGRGVMTIGPVGVLSLLASMRAMRAPSAGVALRTLLDFLGFYAKNLEDVSFAGG